MSGDSERSVLPQSLDAERSVVGGVLLHPRALSDVAPLVEPEDFYHPTLGAIYAAMLELDGDGKPVDELTLAEQLRATDQFGKLRAHGGEAFFDELRSAVVTVENIAHHAKLVRGKATLRRVIAAAEEIAAKGRGRGVDVESFIAESEQALLAATGRSTAKEPRSAHDIALATIDIIERRVEEYKRGRTVVGIPSGNFRIDELLGGFRQGEQYVIAARPSEGKTSIAGQWMLHAARQGVPVLVFSLEMSSELLVEHMISHEAAVNSMALRNGWVDDIGFTASHKAASRISSLPFWILDDQDINLRTIRAVARRWRARHTKPGKPAIVVLDYLQLVEGDDERKDSKREREIARLSRGMKKLAKELQLSTFVISQLNRGPEKDEKTPREPRVTDLRESGAIEQDADTIMLLHPLGDGITKVIVGKNKNGPKSYARLRFVREYYRFLDTDDGEAAA